MKIYSFRSCIMIAVLLTFHFAINAQTKDQSENTKDGFSTQLRKGTVPGLKFAPVNSPLQTRKEDNNKEPENTIRNIKMGIGPNIKKSSGSGDNAVSTQPDKTQSKLPSDKKPELNKEEIKTTRPVIPTQETTQENQQKKQSNL